MLPGLVAPRRSANVAALIVVAGLLATGIAPGARAAQAHLTGVDQPSPAVIAKMLEREIALVAGKQALVLPPEALTRMVVERLAAEQLRGGDSRDPGAAIAALERAVHEVVVEQAMRARMQAAAKPAPLRVASQPIIVHATAIGAGERQALLDLYTSTNGGSWTNNTNWNGAAGTECTWSGVTCDAGQTTAEVLNLQYNNLVGTLPTTLGNLTNLRYLDLLSNQLSGAIPTELGNLTNLQTLNLSFNQLSGAIPTELGNLTNLWRLGLSSNQLVGAVPSSITNLTNLGGGDFRWNGLYSADSTVVSFLNGKQNGGDWQSTQTVPVTNLAAGSPTSSSIALTWTPITYTGDTGGYQVFYATTSGGPYVLSGTTADKSATGWTVTGLAAGTTSYFIVKSVTNPHANNQNTVVSDPTAEISASTLGPLVITTTSPLPAGVVGSAYGETFTATGGAGGYSWSVTAGSPPPVLLLSSAGVLSGDPTTVGSYSFTVQVTDADGNTTSTPFTLQIYPTPIPLLRPLGLLGLIVALGSVGLAVLRRITP